MKKLSFYILVSAFYIFKAICILSTFETAVSIKYEVDEAYFAVDTNNRWTTSERSKEYGELHVKERSYG